MNERPAKPPIADSPLFWLLLFGLVALAALIVVGPRYARRQGQLQQKWEARQRSAREAAEQPGAATTADAETPPPANPPTLRPLFLVIMGFVAVVALGLLIQRTRK
jgi:hypothetical protein